MSLVKVQFSTSQGPIRVIGTLSKDKNRPVLLVIKGAFPTADQFSRLPHLFPGADVALVNLPGMHSPHFEHPSIGAFAVALDEVVAKIFSGRDVTVMGVSIGGVVAFAMASPIREILALDTPLSTSKLWPIEDAVNEWRALSPDYGRWIDGIWGRDYRPILVLCKTPITLMMGDRPLPDNPPPKYDKGIPSLISTVDREAYSLAENVREIVTPATGHDIAAGAPFLLMDELCRMLRQERPASMQSAP